jgi:hypothetical protein
MASGVLLGTAFVTAALWLVRILQADAAPATVPDLTSWPARVLVSGTLGGLLLAAVTTWTALAPIGSTWRQGGLSIVASFATVVVSLIAAPVDALLGRWGLLGLAGLTAWAGLRTFRRAARGAAR